MATPVLMPRLSPTMEEGVIAEWLVKEGDSIETSALLCEIETDKASMEYESPDEGKVIKILAKTGETIKVDTLIAIIAEDGESVDIDSFIKEHSSSSNGQAAQTTESTAPEKQAETPKTKTAASPASTSDSRVKASPLAKSIAKQKNINLTGIKGSGPNGRIIAADIESAPASTAASAPAFVSRPVLAGDEFEDIKNSTMRNVIAKRLLESSQGAPEFFLTIDVNMKNAIAFRDQLKAAFPDIKVTYNDMVIKATAMALRQNPKCNASWRGDSIRFHKNIHISVAVAIEDGLITPVIRNADMIGLADISAQVRELAGRAKDKKLQPEEYTGGTFSVSNLGMFGIEQFTSILNPPESGIFAVGAVVEKAVVENGQLLVGNSMKVTMTCDHRVIDGATGANLLKDFKRILENPTALAL
ncbi:MAG: pyruvate dehydrogenase complex dihydrolipoamide acetyltransferase [Calditrichaeota bacterium]|nr:pyruvate dehydrogenase complex dihydrolipoamide acetyltransferase [Calditrichota bacterium]